MKKPRRLVAAAAAAVLAMGAIPLAAYAKSSYTKITGDVNGDTIVSKKDEALVKRSKAKKSIPDSVTLDNIAGDVNRDGLYNDKDIEAISKYVEGWDGYDAIGKEFTDQDVTASFKITDLSVSFKDDTADATIEVTGGVAPYTYKCYRYLGVGSEQESRSNVGQSCKMKVKPGEAYFFTVTDSDENTVMSDVIKLNSDKTVTRYSKDCHYTVELKDRTPNENIVDKIKLIQEAFGDDLTEAKRIYSAAAGSGTVFVKRFLTWEQAKKGAATLYKDFTLHVRDVYTKEEFIFAAPIGVSDEKGVYALQATGYSGQEPYSYKWYKGSTVVTDDDDDDSVLHVLPQDIETYYYVVTDKDDREETSESVSITPIKPIVKISQSSSAYNKVDLYAEVKYGTEPYTYKWYNDSNVWGNYETLSNMDADIIDKEGMTLLVTDKNGFETEATVHKAYRPVYKDLKVESFFNPYANSHPPYSGTSMEWTQKTTASATVRISGGAAPYKYTWYIDGKENYGLKGTGWDEMNHGISSSDTTNTIYVDAVKYLDKEIYCVITDGRGKQLTTSTRNVRLFDTLDDTKPLAECYDSTEQRILMDTLVYDTLHLRVRFRDGAKLFDKMTTHVYVRKKGSTDWTSFAVLYGGKDSSNDWRYYDCDSNSMYGYVVHFKLDLNYMKDFGIRTDMDNIKVVIEDRVTNSTLEYTTRLGGPWL